MIRYFQFKWQKNNNKSNTAESGIKLGKVIQSQVAVNFGNPYSANKKISFAQAKWKTDLKKIN